MLQLHGNEKLDEEASELLNLFLEKNGWIDAANFRGVCMEDIAAVEDIVQSEFFL